MDLVRCHHHQAWTLTTAAYLEDADLTPADGGSTVHHFGPFDSIEDVLAYCAEFLAAATVRAAAAL